MYCRCARLKFCVGWKVSILHFHLVLAVSKTFGLFSLLNSDISPLSKSMFSLLKHIISLNVEQSNAMKTIMFFLNLSLSW